MIELDALLIVLGPVPTRGRTSWLHHRLSSAITREELPAGVRLPGLRLLADSLGMARGTATEAVARLVDEGRLEARPRSGYVVAALPARSEPALPVPAPAVRHSPGVGDLALFPRTGWLRSLQHAVTTMPHVDLGYVEAGGIPELRRVLAAYLTRTRAAVVEPEHLIVVNGAAQAISLIARVAARVGHTRWVMESPHPPGMRQVLEHLGCEVDLVAVDEEGILAREIRGPGLLLLTPAHQVPTGVRLSAARRRAVVERVAAEQMLLVEDDYDGDLPLAQDRVGVLQAVNPSNTLLIGSVSKSLAPGLRLGWLVAPPGWAEAIAAERALTDLGSPVIDQWALAHFIESGAYDRHLRRVRKEYASRRGALVSVLRKRGYDVSTSAVAGLHVFVPISVDLAGALAVAIASAGLAAQAAADSPVGGVVVGVGSVSWTRLQALDLALSALHRRD